LVVLVLLFLLNDKQRFTCLDVARMFITKSSFLYDDSVGIAVFPLLYVRAKVFTIIKYNMLLKIKNKLALAKFSVFANCFTFLYRVI